MRKVCIDSILFDMRLFRLYKEMSAGDMGYNFFAYSSHFFFYICYFVRITLNSIFLVWSWLNNQRDITNHVGVHL